MLLIACPFCGPRPELEFSCGGQAHIARPGPPEAVSDAEWAQYLFYRDNPKGLARERWRHGGGCGQWFNAVRDTLTHDFKAVYPMGAPAPEIG